MIYLVINSYFDSDFSSTREVHILGVYKDKAKAEKECSKHFKAYVIEVETEKEVYIEV